MISMMPIFHQDLLEQKDFDINEVFLALRPLIAKNYYDINDAFFALRPLIAKKL